jgi:hypothetical protein
MYGPLCQLLKKGVAFRPWHLYKLLLSSNYNMDAARGMLLQATYAESLHPLAGPAAGRDDPYIELFGACPNLAVTTVTMVTP